MRVLRCLFPMSVVPMRKKEHKENESVLLHTVMPAVKRVAVKAVDYAAVAALAAVITFVALR